MRSGSVESSLSTSVEGSSGEEINYKEEYAVDDIVKTENMMFDIESLYSTTITFETVENTVPNVAKYAGIQGGFINGVDYLGEETKVFVYYGIPQTEAPEKGFPAVVLVHGAGGTAYYEWVHKWVERGYAAIAVDIGGRKASKPGYPVKNPQGGPEPYNMVSDTAVEPTDSWIYFSVCSIIHANNFLRAQEKIDKESVGLIGLSWGGVLSLITSGVDKRFAAFTYVYACGFLHEEEWGKNDLKLSSLSAENLEKFIKYYDPSGYVGYATKLALFSAGANDVPFSMPNRKRTAELMKGKTFFSLKRQMSHYNEVGYTELYESFAFMDHILKNQPLDAQLDGDLLVSEGSVKFSFADSSSKISTLKLVYTTSDVERTANPHDWVWEEKDLTISDDLQYEIPLPEGTTALFINFSDENGCVMSSGMQYT